MSQSRSDGKPLLWGAMMKDMVHEEAIAPFVTDALSSAGYGSIPSASGGTGSAALQMALLPDRFQGRYRSWGKRSLDVMLVLLTLPISAVIIGICAIALWFEGGSPFYTQERLGARGRRFRILKLRTMARDADARLATLLAQDPDLRAEWRDTQKLKNDPRITRIGRILRATSIDELPQIWNVLRGDMSLVGPRPMMPEQLPMYGDARAYFALRPGITGAWQVAARNEDSFGSRRAFDADYHTYHSFWEDALLLWQTVFVVLRRTGY